MNLQTWIWDLNWNLNFNKQILNTIMCFNLVMGIDIIESYRFAVNTDIVYR